MEKGKFIDFYRSRGKSEEETNQAVLFLEQFEYYLQGKKVDDATEDEISTFLKTRESLEAQDIVALARYFHVVGNTGSYVFMTRYLGGVGVIDSIISRYEQKEGKQAAQALQKAVPEPPIGTPHSEIPAFTSRFIDMVEKKAKPENLAWIMSGNNHGIPVSSFSEERKRYLESENIDEYLKDLHIRRVATLKEHCDEGKVWFEQKITQQVVDYVASNQEILSAVRDGDKLYATKIPYDPDSFLSEKDPVMRSYYACHCPFAREAIRNKDVNISENWCYCSAGFEKVIFETILGSELEIKLVSTALGGNDSCRFEISLKGVDYRK